MSDRVPDGVRDTDEGGDGLPRASGKWRARLLVALFAVPVVAGGVTGLVLSGLTHPFGDARACDGSEVALPAAIEAAGATLPQDATDVRYYTHDGEAVVSFVSELVPDYLVRAGLIPDRDALFARQDVVEYAMEPGTSELPRGLCGEGLRAPAWSGTTPDGMILVERAPSGAEELRRPARVQVTFRYTDPAP